MTNGYYVICFMNRFKIFTAACLIVFASCNKKEGATKVNDVVHMEQSTAKRSLPTVSKTDNPFDRYGEIHNAGLKALAEYKKETGDATRKGKKTFLENWYQAQTGNKISLPEYISIEKEVIEDYRSVLKGLVSSADAKRYMNQLCDAVEKIDAVSDSAYQKFVHRIQGIERVIGSSKLSDQETSVLQCVASMMRYSGAYWNVYLQSVEEQFNQDGEASTHGFFRNVLGYIAAITADATVLGYHHFRMSPIDHMIGEAIWMSEICGYYTGYW